ncbi:MAG: hypothetical protein ACRC2S_05530 [Waterburya sp.]
MRSLREFATFVGKPNAPISPRALVEYLRLEYLSLGITYGSVREMIQSLEGLSFPVAFDAVVAEPNNRIVPFTSTMRFSSIKSYFFAARWRILRGGQQVAAYDRLLDNSLANGGLSAEHTFSEAGTYTVEGTIKGIGINGYGEATKSVTVVAKSNTPPPPSNWRLSLRLAPVELSLSTLRIISATWKVTPLWNPSQVFNLTGSNAENRYTSEVMLPNPPSNAADSRVQVELKFRCAVAGVLEGVEFPYGEFDGIVNPTFIGWENKSLKAGWFGQYEVVQNPITGLAKVNVAALFQGVEPL